MIITYGRQHIEKDDIKEVSNSLKSNIISGGLFVKKFENSLKKKLKSKYTLVCSSGTAALHLSLMAINLKNNDVIIMPAVNFIAVHNLAKLINAKIYLADVDSNTGQMTPKHLMDCINKYKLKSIKAVVTMYLGGHPENVVEFYKLKKKFDFYLIEDACHALGSKYLFKNRYYYIGSCKHADISNFSLHPLKSITTGEGGIITTNNKSIYKKICLFRSHGLKRNNKFHWKYSLHGIGLNYRLSDINCALGISQLKKLEKFISKRKKIAKYYQKEFIKKKNLISVPDYNNKNFSSWHLFLVKVNFEKLKVNKNQFMEILKKKRIICQHHYTPIYKLCYNDYKKLNLKGTEEYYKNAYSIPIYYNLSIRSVRYITKTMLDLIDFLKK